jgi:hypothetical protein
MKESEVLALQVLKTAEAQLQAAQAKLKTAVEAVEKASGEDLVARAKLELARDEELRNVQGAEDKYQICKDISDNLTIGYNTSEVIMARLVQTTNAKDRVYKQAVSFFGTLLRRPLRFIDRIFLPIFLYLLKDYLLYIKPMFSSE